LVGALTIGGTRKACLGRPDPLDDAQSARRNGAISVTDEDSMSKRQARAVETRKKKARRAIPRAKVTRNQGNTAGVRKLLKKQAGKARAAAKVATA